MVAALRRGARGGRRARGRGGRGRRARARGRRRTSRTRCWTFRWSQFRRGHRRQPLRRAVLEPRGGALDDGATGAAAASSISGRSCRRCPRRARAYSVSKAGVWMLTKCLAQELATHGIRVNAIGPGFIETPMTAALRDDAARSRWAMSVTPMGRYGTPRGGRGHRAVPRLRRRVLLHRRAPAPVGRRVRRLSVGSRRGGERAAVHHDVGAADPRRRRPRRGRGRSAQCPRARRRGRAGCAGPRPPRVLPGR